MKFTSLALLALAAIPAAMTTPALARQPGYVGTWAQHRSACSIPQDKRSAPMIVTARGYDRHETHCKFQKVTHSISGWTIKSICSVEGDKQTHHLKLTAGPDRLTIHEGGRSQVLVKC